MAISVKDAAGTPQTIKTIDDLIAESGVVTEANPLAVALQSSTAHVGRVGGTSRRPSASFVRPSHAVAYALGDHIANSQTAASVVPMEFTVARVTNGSGRITGATCIITAATGTAVIPKFDLLLFRPQGNVPHVAGAYPADNGALILGADDYAQLVASISFSDVYWRNQAGGSTAAGAVLYQSAPISPRQFAPFDLNPLGVDYLRGVVQAQSAWNPGAVDYTLTFYLDVDQD